MVYANYPHLKPSRPAASVQETLDRLAKMQPQTRPHPYQKPPYNTPEYWQDVLKGWITEAETEEDERQFQIRRQRAKDSKYNVTPAPTRHDRPAPQKTKQFCKPISTEAARDDRLTPQAKALLQVLAARTGKGHVTDSCKVTLGKIMNRSARSIQRYIQELIKFDYIQTQILKHRLSGMYRGLRIWITNKVLPYFAQGNPKFCPVKWRDFYEKRLKSDRTEMSPTKFISINKDIKSDEKPPWSDRFAFR